MRRSWWWCYIQSSPHHAWNSSSCQFSHWALSRLLFKSRILLCLLLKWWTRCTLWALGCPLVHCRYDSGSLGRLTVYEEIRASITYSLVLSGDFHSLDHISPNFRRNKLEESSWRRSQYPRIQSYLRDIGTLINGYAELKSAAEPEQWLIWKKKSIIPCSCLGWLLSLQVDMIDNWKSHILIRNTEWQ